ncbi:MAG: adventurous gliding motility lipoprotein CglB [Archangium sp.]
MRTIWAMAGVTLVLSCQVYDFERVVPTTVSVDSESTVIESVSLKPNVMLLVDNSASMDDPADEAVASCRNGAGVLCGYRNHECPSTCPTRIQELKRAMNELLSTSPTVARLGLTYYPTEDCAAASTIDQQFPPGTLTDSDTDGALTAQSSKIALRLMDFTPEGGTPTGASLRFVGEYSELSRDDLREDFVLLLTDGLPNCNDSNRNNVCGCFNSSCSQPQLDACRCTNASCLFTGVCSTGCLDRQNVVEAITELRGKKIRTIVVGFGADLTQGDAPAVLNDMALAGGFARPCTLDADCGDGACNVETRTCSTAYYRARTGEELGEALQSVWLRIPANLCTRVLRSPPDDPRFISVLVNGENLVAGADTWTYDTAASAVLLHGTVCERLKASTSQNPVTLEIRSARKL